MKFNLFLTFLLSSLNAFACPDFSGSYHDIKSESRYAFKQTGCEQIEFARFDGKLEVPTYESVWITDGVPREINEDFGKMVYSIKIQFIGEKLVFDVTGFNKDLGHFEMFSHSEMYLKDNSFVEHFTAYDGNQNITDHLVNVLIRD